MSQIWRVRSVHVDVNACVRLKFFLNDKRGDWINVSIRFHTQGSSACPCVCSYNMLLLLLLLFLLLETIFINECICLYCRRKIVVSKLLYIFISLTFNCCSQFFLSIFFSFFRFSIFCWLNPVILVILPLNTATVSIFVFFFFESIVLLIFVT